MNKEDVTLKIVLLRARVEALLQTGPPEVVADLERAVSRLERKATSSRLPRGRKGRPPLPSGTLRELLLNVDLQKLLSGRPMTDKEAVERLVQIQQPHLGHRPRWTLEQVRAEWRKRYGKDLPADAEKAWMRLPTTRRALIARELQRLKSARKKSKK